MTCAQLQQHLGDWLADRLPAAEEARLRAHLRQCSACRSYLWEREPAAALGICLPQEGFEDSRFVSEVLSGLRQRRAEQSLAAKPSWKLGRAAAALLLVGLAAAAFGHRARPWSGSPLRAQQRPAVEPFVEVEGEGVRVYQLATGEKVQVAFIVSPTMEF